MDAIKNAMGSIFHPLKTLEVLHLGDTMFIVFKVIPMVVKR